MRRAAVLALVLPALLLTACSKTIEPDGAAESVVDVVSRKTGFTPKDVDCPSGVDAEVGGTFECHFTGPEGEPYTAHMEILEVNGEEVLFQVDSRPSTGRRQ